MMGRRRFHLPGRSMLMLVLLAGGMSMSAPALAQDSSPAASPAASPSASPTASQCDTETAIASAAAS